MIFRIIIYLDINECATQPCHTDAVCANNKGSYNCTCDLGFVGHGFSSVGMLFLRLMYFSPKSKTKYERKFAFSSFRICTKAKFREKKSIGKVFF